MKYFLAVLFFIIGVNVRSQEISFGYKIISLKTIKDKVFKFPETKKPYTVFIFYSPECPLSQQYTRTINQLFKDYSDSVNFVGVFPGNDYDNEKFNAFKKKYKILYTLVKDEKMQLTKYLKATTTPEVFLLHELSGKLIYSGAIDNWILRLGQTRQQATINYLENAVVNSLHATSVSPAFVKPIGCYIEK